MLSVVAVLGQTPLEVIRFYKAYSDTPIVNKASQTKAWTPEFVQYVIDESNPMETRMAVINAIGVGQEAASLTHAITTEPNDNITALLGYAVAMEYYKSERKLNQILETFDKHITQGERSIEIIHYIIYAQLHPNAEGVDLVRDACYGRYYNDEYPIREKALDLIYKSLSPFENIKSPVTFKIYNKSSNPYKLEINGKVITTIEGRGSFNYDCKAGYYHIKATQVSGYAFYPTINEKDIQAEETGDDTSYYEIEIGY